MEENVIKRVMPQSTEAEKSVIGAMFLDNESISAVEGILLPEDFYQKQYGIIYEAMLELFREGKPFDKITLQTRLEEKEAPAEISNLNFFGELLADVPISANAKYYAEIVKEKSTLRNLIRTCENVTNECYAGKEKLSIIMDETEKNVFNVLNTRRTTDFVPIDQIVIDAMDRIKKASLTKNPITGVATGFRDLDLMLSGLQPSDLILVAARPSMGKTALALNMAQHAALKNGLNVAIFSLEMSKEQLVNRLLAMEARIDAQNIRTGNFSDDDWEKLTDASVSIGNSSLILDDTSNISLAELRTKCRQYQLQKGLDLILIDYLQLMSGGSRRSESRQQEVSEISRGLKAIARELKVPIIALSQLSRQTEQRTGHRPQLSDLRESGAIEQDADVVMFIHRDDYYDKESEAANEAEIIIAKQRNGPTGSVHLAWLPKYTKFVNLEKNKER